MAGRDKKRTEVKTEVVFLGKLVERVTEGKLRIPKFQRPFVWRHEDMRALLDSVTLGFPIGSILVWDTAHEVSSLDHVGPIAVGEPPAGIVTYLLDGQQRVSTLVGALQLAEDAAPIDGDIDWRLYYDLEAGEFLQAPRDGLKAHHFPVRNLLSTTGYLRSCAAIQNEVSTQTAERLLKAADRLVSSIRDYQVPVITVKDADLDTAVSVFARLNKRGRKIAPDQMVSALTYREGAFQLAERLDQMQEEFEQHGFGSLDRVFILRTVLAAMERDIYANDWTDLMVKEEVRAQLPEDFERAAEGLRGALGFLHRLGVTSARLLPYGLQIVLLAEHFRLCPDPSDGVRALLERWFWVTSFTGWFGGINTARARQALAEMREVARGSRTDFDVVDLNAEAKPFPRRFDARSARVRAFLLFLASFEPRSLEHPAEPLDVGRLLSDLGPRAIGYVVSGSLAEDLGSSPANRMFVDRGQRGQALGTLRDLEDDELTALLDSHGFSSDALSLLRKDDRDALLRARLARLIDEERQFLEARNVKSSSDRLGETVRDSDVSDDD